MSAFETDFEDVNKKSRPLVVRRRFGFSSRRGGGLCWYLSLMPFTGKSDVVFTRLAVFCVINAAAFGYSGDARVAVEQLLREIAIVLVRQTVDVLLGQLEGMISAATRAPDEVVVAGEITFPIAYEAAAVVGG